MLKSRREYPTRQLFLFVDVEFCFLVLMTNGINFIQSENEQKSFETDRSFGERVHSVVLSVQNTEGGSKQTIHSNNSLLPDKLQAFLVESSNGNQNPGKVEQTKLNGSDQYTVYSTFS